ncbi:hypothetical protein F5Y01DRAFT_51566 [Xylaria sp. FL0043]|nr:hypothetical protein F5Y01DRAFT_51566 [Xylaria sp. FL0043]
MADKRKVPPTSPDSALGQLGNPSKRRLIGFKTEPPVPVITQQRISEGSKVLRGPTIVAACFKDLEIYSTISKDNTADEKSRKTSSFEYLGSKLKRTRCNGSSVKPSSTSARSPTPESPPGRPRGHDNELEKHWHQYRPLIEDFYQTQNMSLRETMQNMEDDHGFFATTQEYELFLWRWGLLRERSSSTVMRIRKRNTIESTRR